MKKIIDPITREWDNLGEIPSKYLPNNIKKTNDEYLCTKSNELEDKMKRLLKKYDAPILAIGIAFIIIAVLCLLAFIKIGLN